MVCTSTASGKSLCYNLPILEALVKDPRATALYMFPTKALAQDQLRALRELCAAAFGDKAPSIDIYDGDTPQVRHQDASGFIQLHKIASPILSTPKQKQPTWRGLYQKDDPNFYRHWCHKLGPASCKCAGP